MNERIKLLAEQAGITMFGDAVYMSNSNDTLDVTVMNTFAELIVRECVAQCGSQADRRSILSQFGLPVESNIKYSGPDAHWSVTSQYSREYNMPEQSKDRM